MKYWVYLEGVDKSGKTSLLEYLDGWRSDDFKFVDRGPWSRCLYARLHGEAQLEDYMREYVFTDLFPPSIVILVRRDLERVAELQKGDENSTLEELKQQEAMMDELLRTTFPPTHLLEVENRETVPIADLAIQVKQRLESTCELGQPS